MSLQPRVKVLTPRRRRLSLHRLRPPVPLRRFATPPPFLGERDPRERPARPPVDRAWDASDTPGLEVRPVAADGAKGEGLGNGRWTVLEVQWLWGGHQGEGGSRVGWRSSSEEHVIFVEGKGRDEADGGMEIWRTWRT